jgi:flagellar motor switch protein FliN/FliY
MDPVTLELNQKVGSCFSESMSSVFSMLTGRDFVVVVQESNELDHLGVATLHDAPAIFVKALYSKGMTGPLIFALPLKEGTILVDLMLGGEGTPSTELAGDSKDALAETFNQIMGSANQTLSDIAGETLSISTVEISMVEGKDQKALENLMGPGPFNDLPISTTQESLKATIHLLLPDALTQQMKRKLGLGEALAPVAPPAPAPAAAPAKAQVATTPVSAPVSAPAAGPVAQVTTSSADVRNLDLLLDIELPVVVRMGQTEMQLGELLKLTPGSILELNRAADAPVELLVNGKQIAKGEVVVVDGNFAFRITEIESTAARIRSLA